MQNENYLCKLSFMCKAGSTLRVEVLFLRAEHMFLRVEGLFLRVEPSTLGFLSRNNTFSAFFEEIIKKEMKDFLSRV